jgi:hypothetical protein
MFEHVASTKGFNITYDDTTQQKTNDLNRDKQDILEANDITPEIFNAILKLQEKRQATTEQKKQIKKHLLKHELGLDRLDIDIIKKFYKKGLMNNFTYLIDNDNIRNTEQQNQKEIETKLEYIRNIIKMLGYEHMFDSKCINESEFDQKLHDAILYIIEEGKTNKNFKLLMNASNERFENVLNYTRKAKIGFINGHYLSAYGIKISCEQFRVTGQKNKTNKYSLKVVSNMEELLAYKIQKGFHLYDRGNIFRDPLMNDGYQCAYSELVVIHDVREKPSKMGNNNLSVSGLDA